ncbi:MAG: outer membrane beta-barrel protein [Bacteroidales bacterium]|nr:outer membrane beta-barrel protein [Bacteroidales bacterium]MBN2697628.1 outer membrane beta-barrel protein [Bacteroidales bacterium]
MKVLAVSIFLGFLCSVFAPAQPDRIGAGLSFANPFEFNGGETSNPGFFLKTWIGLDRKGKVHLVPSVTAYNRYKYDPGTFILKNYLFQGDMDGQYVVFREKTLKVIGFAGVNFTYVTSTFEPLNVNSGFIGADASDWAVGGNIGAGLEMRMTDHWDFNVSGKYKISKYDQFIISVGAAYFFRDRGRTYRRR